MSLKETIQKFIAILDRWIAPALLLLGIEHTLRIISNASYFPTYDPTVFYLPAVFICFVVNTRYYPDVLKPDPDFLFKFALSNLILILSVFILASDVVPVFSSFLVAISTILFIKATGYIAISSMCMSSALIILFYVENYPIYISISFSILFTLSVVCLSLWPIQRQDLLPTSLFHTVLAIIYVLNTHHNSIKYSFAIFSAEIIIHWVLISIFASCFLFRHFTESFILMIFICGISRLSPSVHSLLCFVISCSVFAYCMTVLIANGVIRLKSDTQPSI